MPRPRSTWRSALSSNPVAALATLRKHREQNVARHLMRIGARVQKGWAEAATATDLPVHVSGIAPLGHFAFEVPEPQEVRTLFTQMMLDRGIFATGSFYAMFAHTDDIDLRLAVTRPP